MQICFICENTFVKSVKSLCKKFHLDYVVQSYQILWRLVRVELQICGNISIFPEFITWFHLTWKKSMWKKRLRNPRQFNTQYLATSRCPVLCTWCQQWSKLHSYKFILLLSANSWHEMGEYLLQSLMKWAVGSIFTCPQAQPYKGQMISLPAVGQTAGSVDHFSPVGVLQAKRMKWPSCAQY